MHYAVINGFDNVIEHYLNFDGDKSTLWSIEDKKKKWADAYGKRKLMNGYDYIRSSDENGLRKYLENHDVNFQSRISKNTMLHIAV